MGVSVDYLHLFKTQGVVAHIYNPSAKKEVPGPSWLSSLDS